MMLLGVGCHLPAFAEDDGLVRERAREFRDGVDGVRLGDGRPFGQCRRELVVGLDRMPDLEAVQVELGLVDGRIRVNLLTRHADLTAEGP